MRNALVLVLFATSSAAAGAADAPRRCEPWEAAYAAADATGEHVLGLWSLDGPDPTADAAGRGYQGRLEGGRIEPQGRFGAALASAPGWPVEDKPHRLLVAPDPRLSPAGAFTLEMWIQPAAELAGDYPESFLLDKKYVDPSDYQLVLGAPDRAGLRTLRAALGFGDDTVTYHARPARFEPGVWRHIAFTYDGAGTGSFFLDGIPWGTQQYPGRGPVRPGRHALSIGDRIGSYYHGFPGLIDEVRITRGAREFRRVACDALPGRRVFRRMEPGMTLRLAVTNLQPVALGEGLARIGIAGAPPQEVALAGLAPDARREIAYPVPTDLRPDEYRVTAEISVQTPQPYNAREEFAIRIVPRPAPDRFPVVMWGGYGNASREFDRLKEIGFTHVLGLGANYGKIWEAGQPGPADDPERVAKSRADLDEALARDIVLAASLSPAAALGSREELRRVGRDGKPYAGHDDVCALLPTLKTFCHNVGASVAQTYGDHPAFGAALLHTEVRDGARPCFHAEDQQAFLAAAGFPVPAEVTASPRGVDYRRLAGFPASRVIPRDHPLLVYFRWYWKTGDGWNELNTALHRGLKSTGRSDLWTWHDPAARVASVYGTGGEVDYLSQWTYSYPDPIRIGLATDELLAYSRGASAPQQVMKMTQIIWYRSQTAPEPKTPADRLPYQARWEREQPDAPFITIAPLHLREAFWTKIARPIRGMMYHGWQSLVPCDDPSGYRYTHPQTQHELARLVRTVVEPLGPTLLHLPGVRSDVALLKSFTAEMFAGRGTFGWGGGWAGDAWHVLAYAHLQPDIVLDETVTQRGLDGYRVLVLPDGDVLTADVAQRIEQFQAGGGIVVGDERLAPAIRPDIVLPIYQRTGRADADKAALQTLAADLRKQLDARYTRYLDTTEPDAIPYLRRHGAADYVFLVNDRREYGDYVGQHGLVMENGLATEAMLTVARPAGHVYDLVAHQPVAAQAEGDRLRVPVRLGPCDGRLMMITDRPIAGVRAAVAQQEVARGGRAEVAVEVVDGEGRPLAAVLPLEVTIRDAEGRPAEFSGAHAAVDGRLRLVFDIAPNDPPGQWQVEVCELASGQRAGVSFRVAGEQPWPPLPAPPPAGAANPVQPQG